LHIDTIFALGSGKLPAGIAVIRISGSHVKKGLVPLCGPFPSPKMMQYRQLTDLTGQIIDTCLIVFFKAPHSFTGEDCVELHVHGSRAVVKNLLNYLGNIPDFRPAEAGEFTRRAFMNGKLDITQAEGLADLLSAETDAQRKLALYQSSGGLKNLYECWRRQLLTARAMIEAHIDFFDEDDVAARAIASFAYDMKQILKDIHQHISGYRSGEIIREGYHVVIAGAPNAGKSSLMNALVQREVAISSDEEGTTRDTIDVRLEVSGNLIILTDTAGLRHTDNKVEAIGIARAKDKITSADLILLVLNMNDMHTIDIDPTAPLLRVGTHLDNCYQTPENIDFPLSTVNGQGIKPLLDEIGRRANEATITDTVIPTRERQIALLRSTAQDIEKCLNFDSDHSDLIAEHLRLATENLGKLVGCVGVEELLDVIFSQFCIGK
jgi:tRNA modification GTPase